MNADGTNEKRIDLGSLTDNGQPEWGPGAVTPTPTPSASPPTVPEAPAAKPTTAEPGFTG